MDTDDDGDFADETTLLDTTTIDDVWSAGHVGLFRGSVSNAQDFDDFRAGIDANADLDIADAGDEVVVDDDFATSVVSPAYDNNGNLTDDGVNKHVYDGWNRHVKSTWRIKSPPSAVVAYEHDGSNRRVSKVVTNSGVENTANDGGNTTQEYLFANGRLIEERNGSNQLTRAYMWHDGQLVWFEANGDPSIGNDSNPDLTATGEGSEAVADKRYFHHADHRGRSSTLTDYVSGGGAANGRVAERIVRVGNSSRAYLVGDERARSAVRSSAGLSQLIHATGGHPVPPMYGSDGPDDPPPCHHPEECPAGTFDPVDHDPPGPLTPLPPFGTPDCTVEWRFEPIAWILRDIGHVGLDVHSDDGDFSLDYGEGWNDRCCKNNTRWQNGDQPGQPHTVWPPNDLPLPPTRPPGVVMPPTFCDCLRNEAPEQYGPCCSYNVFGVGGSNSNGAIRALVEHCEQRTGTAIARPPWANDWNLPGWNNVPAPLNREDLSERCDQWSSDDEKSDGVVGTLDAQATLHDCLY